MTWRTRRVVTAGNWRRPLARSRSATIGETAALIIDPGAGKYPHDSPNRRELLRALRFAALTWGADRPWDTIEEADWLRLLRARLEDLLARNCAGVRSTEITVSRLVTAVGWLRSAKHIARDAAPWPKDWKAEIVKHWKGLKQSVRDPQPQRLRHTPEEARAILRASTFDPRFDLLMWCGMELRLGQVCRCRRSDLTLPPVDWTEPVDPENDPTDYGTLVVVGAGKKGGTTVDLTRGQRQAIMRALAEGGYLHELEMRHRQDGGDYLLFPSGYVVGRVGRTRGKKTTLRLGSSARYDRHVSSAWVRGAFRTAEKIAGVAHVKGRGAYGLRRVSVDVGSAAKLSPAALQSLGGWTDIKIPETVYREQGNRAGRREARSVRALLRGES